MSSRYRYKCCSAVPRTQESVPAYDPKCCPPPANTDPRRNELYCKPVVSRSEPLSHAEYLRRKRESGGAAISSPAGLVQIGEGAYKRTLWMESNSTASCCQGTDAVLPAVPPVHSVGHRLPNRERTEVRGAIAGRSALSHYDQGNHAASLTIQRHRGDVLAYDACQVCSVLEGTAPSTVPAGGLCGWLCIPLLL